MTPRLDSFTREELNELPYDALLQIRAAAYTRHVKAMAIPDALASWAATMARRYGPKVRIWKNELPWIEALMVARYGEDPSSWPSAVAQDDVDRAIAWMRNKRVGAMKGTAPHGVQYLDLDGGFAKVQALVMAVAIFAGAHALRLIATLGVLLATVAGVWAGMLHPIEGSIVTVVGTALANFWENELIDHLFRARSYTAPTNIYFALYTAAPGETGGGTEVTGGSYARVNVATGFANFEGTNGETTDTDSAGTGGATQNRTAIAFPTPSANWGIASHFAGLSASSSGNFFFYGALTTPKTINNGDPAPSFGVGDFDFSLA